MPTQNYARSFDNLSDAISAASRTSSLFDQFDDFMRDNSPTWRSESRSAFQQDELAESVAEAFVENNSSTHSVTLGGGAYTFRKGDQVAAKIAIDNRANQAITITVSVDGPTVNAPAGFAYEDGFYTKSVRHVSDAFKAAREHSMGVRALIDKLRAGSNTFRQNYDHSYVTVSEMLMSAIEFSGSPQSEGYTIGFNAGRMTILRGTTEVIAVKVSGDLKVFTPAPEAPRGPVGWTLVS